MTPEEAPVGSVIVLGHPANGSTATKQEDGRWLYNHNWTDGFTRRAVDPDDMRMARIIFNPEEHR